MTITRNGYHEVTADHLPDDARRICPLIGNDEIKLCVDARGVMHDFTHIWGSHPPARITWSGRRHNLRQDRYSSNLFEWGFLDLRLAGEEALPAVTAWRQRLHPREGYVETVITRGEVEERTISFVHLEHNLLVFHREYRNLPADADRTITAVYTFCHAGTEEIPFRTTWQPGASWEHGMFADTTADGLVLYRGRAALFTDVPVTPRAVGNRLVLEAELPADGAVTIYLSLNDDLGDDPQLLRIPYDNWMNPHVREVHHENLARMDNTRKPNPAETTAALINRVEQAGFAGMFDSHQRAWAAFFDQVKVMLPPDEEMLTAALETQLYTTRCSYTPFSLPANPFNTSWGAAYFWDERFPIEGLLGFGVMDMPERAAEWRRRILPFCCLMTAGRGARYVSSAVEPGAHVSDRNGTQFYEFFQIGVFVNWIWQYCRYRDDEATWRRYYPIFRECAEFYRRWLLVELPGNNLMTVPLIDVNESIYPVQDGPFTVCAAARILHTAWSTAERLGIADAEMPEWKRLGGLAIHLARHAARASGCYDDFELDDVPAPDIEIDPAVRAWRDEERTRVTPSSAMGEGGGNVTGEMEALPFWSWGSLGQAFVAATQGKAADALAHLKQSLITMMDFAALNESARTNLSDVHHPWFTTGAGAFVRALSRMLLYPKDDVILIAPGIPEGWRDFSFEMPVHHGGTVTVRVEDGTLTELTIRESRPDAPRRLLHVPKRFLPDVGRFTGKMRPLEEGADVWVLEMMSEMV